MWWVEDKTGSYPTKLRRVGCPEVTVNVLTKSLMDSAVQSITPMSTEKKQRWTRPTQKATD